ncbi:MAG: hypothetical protein RIR73_3008 [Chloroflexota bacterium]|jgi:hypothetical protein
MHTKRKFRIVLFIIFPAILLWLAARVIHQGRNLESLLTPTPLVFLDADYKVTIPDKALIKNYLTVSLETYPGTACKLTFIAPSGETQEMDTSADESGICEWRWKLEESYGKGHARLIFTINGVSDTHFIDIRTGF